MIRKLLTRLTQYTETIEIDDGLYPLVLTHGNYISELDGETTEWHDVTPIINADGTITLFRNGDFVGHIAHYFNIGQA